MSDWTPEGLIARILETNRRLAQSKGELAYYERVYDKVWGAAYVNAQGTTVESKKARAKLDPSLEEWRLAYQQKVADVANLYGELEALRIEERWRLDDRYQDRAYDKMEARR